MFSKTGIKCEITANMNIIFTIYIYIFLDIFKDLPARNTPFYPHFSRLPNPTQSSRCPHIWMGFPPKWASSASEENTESYGPCSSCERPHRFKPYPSLRTSNSSKDAIKSNTKNKNKKTNNQQKAASEVFHQFFSADLPC